MNLESIKPVFPVKGFSPLMLSTPACCGSAILWFPPKLAKTKVNNVFASTDTELNAMMIVLGKNFPEFVKEICEDVGVVGIDELPPRRSLGNHVHDTGLYETNSLTHREQALSAGVSITRLTKRVFFLYYLYNLTSTTLNLIKKTLKKGDTLLTISVSGQRDRTNTDINKLLSRNGVVVVKEMPSIHGGRSKMRLHCFTKR